MRFLWPTIPRARWAAMVRIALIGAAIGGVYGALHDQVSYAISPEYFTKMKFVQFRWADAGWPPRVFASVVGFLATWWVGMIAGWVLARFGLDGIPPPARQRVMVRAFAMILVSGLVCGTLGGAMGWLVTRSDVRGWSVWQYELSLRDVRGFAIVAWIHAAGYVGAVLGLVVAGVYVRREIRVNRFARGDAGRAPQTTDVGPVARGGAEQKAASGAGRGWTSGP